MQRCALEAGDIMVKLWVEEVQVQEKKAYIYCYMESVKSKNKAKRNYVEYEYYEVIRLQIRMNWNKENAFIAIR